MLSETAKITRMWRDGQVRVLYVVSAYPRHPGDVITPWLTETIRRLRDRGVDVEVLAPAYRGSPDQVIDGVRVHRFRYAPASLETLTHDQTAPDRIRERPAFLSLVPAYVLAGSRAAVRLARSGRFDAVHVFWPIPHGLFGVAARHASGVPLVCTFFGVELRWMRAQFPMLQSVLRRIVGASDAVTAISSHTAGELRAQVREAYPAIVPFGAAVEPRHTSQPSCKRSDGEPFEVLFVGRLVERKGVSYLLQAVAELSAQHRVRLSIVGDGPLRSSLMAAAGELGISDIVRFYGAVPQAELEARFAGCDVFVLPAVTDSKGDTEGLGVVLLEAMAYGKPVVASATGGIVDIVRDRETGLLVPPKDSHAIATAIAAYMTDPGLAERLAASGRLHAEREFGWPAIVDRLTALYAHVSKTQTSVHGAT